MVQKKHDQDIIRVPTHAYTRKRIQSLSLGCVLSLAAHMPTRAAMCLQVVLDSDAMVLPTDDDETPTGDVPGCYRVIWLVV